MLATATLEARMSLSLPRRLAWTHATVSERIQEAMATLKAMPATNCFPAGARSTMPQPVQRMSDWMPEFGSPTFDQDYRHLLERVADERNSTRSVPTAAGIARMEEALAWQWLVGEPKHWRCLAAWAAGGRTGPVARRYGVSNQAVRDWRRLALNQIVWALNEDEGLPKNRKRA
jgi:hypothetical protein